MNNSTYRFTLDLQKHNSQKSIAVFQHDTAVKLYIGLTDGGRPYELSQGCYAVFYGKRSDDKVLVHMCEPKDTTELIYEFKKSTAAVAGIVECQIRVYSADARLITAPKFAIVVEERVVSDNDIDIEDDDRYDALDELFAKDNERTEAEDLRNESELARLIAEDAREQAEAERKSVWIKYSAYSNGAYASDTWHRGLDYIGIATAHDCPTHPKEFQWVLVKGNKGDKGEKGDPFTITKIYSSIAQMEANFSSAVVPTGSFVMIETDNPNNNDNGRLYVKTATGYTFVTDLSGTVGMKGEPGAPGTDGISATHYWDGTRLTVTSASGTSSADLKGDKGDRGYSAYEIARINGYFGVEAEWVESLKGKDGTDGLSAYDIARAHGFTGSEEDWLNALNGREGTDGASAYEIARVYGYRGTEKEWLDSLKGTNGLNGSDGASAYEVACANGYSGSQTDWLLSLKGKDGTDGLSAYEVAKRNGYTGTEIEWLLSLKGTNGTNGKSNYEIACENGFDGDEIDWLNSMKGTNGLSAYEVAKLNGYTGTVEEWLESLKGRNGSNGSNGSDGASAYEIAKSNGFEGTQAEWLASLKGANGKDGNSAYAIAKLNGFTGTITEWLDSLNGVSAEHHWEGTTLTVTSASGTSSEDLKGEEGKSAYQSACDNGFKGTEAEWLDYLNGTTKHIITTDGSLLRVFVGTQAQYDATEDKNNLFAVITNDDDGDKFDAVVKATLHTEGLEYRLSDDESYYICTGIGSADSADIRIPSEYNGLPVKEIGSKAFFVCGRLKTVTIPDSVTKIGMNAFLDCTGLTTVNVGNGVTTIDSYAFRGCNHLKCINIPNSVNHIGKSAIPCAKAAIYCARTTLASTWDRDWRTDAGGKICGTALWGRSAPDVAEAARADIATTAETADKATHATTADSAEHATTADSATTADRLSSRGQTFSTDFGTLTGSTLYLTSNLARPLAVAMRGEVSDAPYENVVVYVGNSSRSANGYYCYRATGGTQENQYLKFYNSSGQLYTPSEVRVIEI